MFVRVKRQLQARGYWDQNDGDGAGGGQGGTGGGSAGGAGDGGDGKGGQGDGGGDGKGADGKGGKSGLSDTEAALLQEVMEKKSKIQGLTTEKTQLAEQLAKLKGFEGLDLEKVKALIAAEQDRETKELEAKGKWDELKKQMGDAHAADKAALEAKIAELTQQLTQASSGAAGKIAELTVGNAFGQSKYIADNLILPVSKARVLFGAHFEFDGERVVAYDKPKGQDNRKQLVDGQGQPLGFDVALQKLVEADPDKDSMLKSKAKMGAGSGTADPAGKQVEKIEVSGRSRIAAALQAQKAK